MNSVGSSDFLFGFTFSGGNTGGYFSYSCHSIFTFLELDDSNLGRVYGNLIGSSVSLVLG